MYKRECKRERVRPHRRELWEKDEDKRGEKGKGNEIDPLLGGDSNVDVESMEHHQKR